MPIVVVESLSTDAAACREFLYSIRKTPDMHFARPWGCGGTPDVTDAGSEESVWFVHHDDSKVVKAVMNIACVDDSHLVLAVLAAQQEQEVWRVDELLTRVLSDLQASSLIVLIWASDYNLPFFLHHRAVICMRKVSEGQAVNLLALSFLPVGEEHVIRLRNADGSNPDHLSTTYLCSARDCHNYGHYICPKCQRVSFCSRACYDLNSTPHVQSGQCKVAPHVRKELFA